MTRAAAIGDERRLGGYALAGAHVVAAAPEEAAAAWEAVPEDVGLVLLTPDVLPALAPLLAERPDVVWAVLP